MEHVCVGKLAIVEHIHYGLVIYALWGEVEEG